jgi:hypothetical protein
MARAVPHSTVFDSVQRSGAATRIYRTSTAVRPAIVSPGPLRAFWAVLAFAA